MSEQEVRSAIDMFGQSISEQMKLDQDAVVHNISRQLDTVVQRSLSC